MAVFFNLDPKQVKFERSPSERGLFFERFTMATMLLVHVRCTALYLVINEGEIPHNN